MIDRRAFLAGSAALLAAPCGSEAERAARVSRIAFVTPTAWNPTFPQFVAFKERMRELGYIEGGNLVVIGRGGTIETMPRVAQELVALNVDVIVVISGAATLAAKQATATIPIVMASTGDAVGLGLISSISRPGGNVTGVSWQSDSLYPKWLQILSEVVPTALRIAVLWDPNDPGNNPSLLRPVFEDASRALKLDLRFVDAPSIQDLQKSFAAFRQDRVDAIVVLPAAKNVVRWQEIPRAALQAGLPSFFGEHYSIEGGGLLAYSVDWVGMARQAATYVDRVLRGAQPADLPVEQPTKYTVIVNLKTAKTLGIAIPASVMLRADRVIE